ncbi:MAG: glutamate racemase [Cloacibacillus sp.]
MKIGIFDSGIGGLSLLQCAMERLPNEDFIYYADEKHVPYGEKSRREIEGFVAEIIAFLLEKKAEAVVIACNTATSTATKAFRGRFPVPVVGMEPAVKRALDLYGESGKRILAAATEVTVKGEKMHRLIEEVDRERLTDLLPLPRLVRLAEAGLFDSREAEDYLRAELAPYDMGGYSSFVLGCTHFNFFKKTLRGLLPPDVRLVDGNEGTVNELCRKAARAAPREKNDGDARSVEFYISGRLACGGSRARFLSYLAWLSEMARIN